MNPDPTRPEPGDDATAAGAIPTSWTRSRWRPSRPPRRRGRRCPGHRRRRNRRRRRGPGPGRRRGRPDRRVPSRGVSARRADRRRGDGQCLSGRAGRRLRATGRRQADQAWDGQRGHRPAVPHRDPRPGRAGEASQHRRADRRRHGRGRPALFRDGVRRRPSDRRVLRRPSAGRPGAAAAVRPGLRRGPVRPSACGDPPRPEAGQHPGHGRRRAEADRLRDRQADRSRTRRRGDRRRPGCGGRADAESASWS